MPTIDASHIKLITEHGEFYGPFSIEYECKPILDIIEYVPCNYEYIHYITQKLPIGLELRYRVEGRISFVRKTGRSEWVKRNIRKLFKQKHDIWQDIEYIYAPKLVLDMETTELCL